MTETLTTIEISRAPGTRYTLTERGTKLEVHLAAPSESGGTGPCICGFNRFSKDVGFSVGGGWTGPGVEHNVCRKCVALRDGRPIRGTHANLFEEPQ